MAIDITMPPLEGPNAPGGAAAVARQRLENAMAPLLAIEAFRAAGIEGDKGPLNAAHAAHAASSSHSRIV